MSDLQNVQDSFQHYMNPWILYDTEDDFWHGNVHIEDEFMIQIQDYCSIFEERQQLKIAFPNVDKINKNKTGINAKHPILTSEWCTMDELKITQQQSEKDEIYVCITMDGSMGIS